MGRFINADDQLDTGAGLLSANLFSFCANNPILFKDSNGRGILLAILIGVGIGLTAGGVLGAYRASKNGKTLADGWDYWKFVVGYGVFGGLLGGLCGWGIGSLAAPVAAETVGSAGTVSAVVYQNWQEAEQALRNTVNSVSSYSERLFQTPFGNRVVDAYNSSEKLIAEAKYGYQALSQFIRTELERDAWLLNSQQVASVEWHFYYSTISRTAGLSNTLFRALCDAGIKVIYHFQGE